MNKAIPTKYLPLLTLGASGLALSLRWMYYAFCMDSQGLLTVPHFLHIACWILTLGAAAFLAVAVHPLKGSNRYEDNFTTSLSGVLGSLLGAAGILITVLTGKGEYPDTLTVIWLILGVLAALGLLAAGVCRFLGRRPFFLFHGLVCAFFALNLTHHYRIWSGDPQSLNYVFQLLSCIALMLAAYYHTAFSVDMGQRRALIFSSMMAVFLCCLSLGHTEAPLFYLGCGAWVFLDLCPLTPPRRRRRRSRTPEYPESPHAHVTQEESL